MDWVNLSKSCIFSGPWFPHLSNGKNISLQDCCIKCNNDWERALKSAMPHKGKVAFFKSQNLLLKLTTSRK